MAPEQTVEQGPNQPAGPSKPVVPEAMKSGGGLKRRVPRSEASKFAGHLTWLSSERSSSHPRRGEVVQEVERMVENIETPIIESNLRILDKLLGLESVYPWQSQSPRASVEGAQDLVSQLYREKKIGPEGRKYIRVLEEGLSWSEASLSLLEGFSTAMPYNFGGTDRMAAELYDKPRKIPTMAKVAEAFHERSDVPLGQVEWGRGGETLRNKAVRLQGEFLHTQMCVSAIGQWRPDGEGNGIKNKRISYMAFTDTFSPEYQSCDENQKKIELQKLTPGKILILATLFNKNRQFNGVGEQKVPKENDYYVKDLPRSYDRVKEGGNKVTLETVKKVFPTEFLQWYTTVDTATDKRNYVATMMAILKTNAMKRCEELELNGGSLGSILKLIDEVEAERKLILFGGVKKERDAATPVLSKIGHFDREFDYKLMEFIIEKGFVEGIGFGTVGEMSWANNYYLNEKGERKRRVDLGSINQATDWYTPMYWLLHKAIYDIPGKKRASIWPASTSGFREKYVETRNPNEKPEVPEGVAKDPVLKDALDKLFDRKDNSGKNPSVGWEEEVRKIIGDPKFDFQLNPAVVKILEDNLWYWETPYTSFRNTEKTNGEIKYDIPWPVFLPPWISSLNMLNSFRPDGRAVWQRLTDGERTLKIPWRDIKDHGYDWGLVNNQMMGRWLKEIVDLKDTEHDRDYVAFYGGIGGLKEMITRFELGDRGFFLEAPGGRIQLETKNKDVVVLEEIPEPILEIMNMPMFVTLSLMDKYHMTSPEFALNPKFQEGFKSEVAEWLVMCYYMPSSKPAKAKNINNEPIVWKFEGYNVGLMKMLWFYTKLAYRIGIDYGARFNIDKTNVMSGLTNKYS